MDPETLAHWQAADALFDQWLDLPEDERDAWLAAQTLSEPVRLRLGQLVAAHRRPHASLNPDGGNLAGRRLGDWILDTELGRGGMAVVYRGWREQGMARQQAAIKILTLGALGASGRERFQREAAILARLNHPNVTALIDSGVADDGTCWLAMPLVDGERIDRWCESHSSDARTVVRMYLQVCDAVAYAHRNLVIHRDLKPSNVLVDANGHVRLLDFGIGQFTDSTEERTQTMWRALTPGYAAPEQLLGAPPSTAIDVYGLGALLHRLLTGRTPQATTEGTETTRPSLLVRSTDDAYHRHYVPLKSDLDRVLLKALAEEPERRYATAEALADDLRRWLDGRPVLAQKPKLGYRLRKLITRNTLGVAATCLLVLTLGAGIGATLWQAEQARQEAENARIQAQRAVQVRDFLGRVFTSAEASEGEVPSALDVLQAGAAAARDEVLADDPLAAADILLITGDARFGLSELEAAATDLEEALRLFQAHDPGADEELWRIHWLLSQINRHRGDNATARKHVEQAMASNARRSASAEDRMLTKLSLGNALIADDPVAAEAIFREVLDEAAHGELADSEVHSGALTGLAVVLYHRGVPSAELVPLIDERNRITGVVHGRQSGEYAFAIGDSVAILRNVPEHFARAEAQAREAAPLLERAFRGPHMKKTGPACQYGIHLLQRGRTREALTQLDASRTNALAVGQVDAPSTRCLAARAVALAALGRLDAAADDLDATVALFGTLGHPDNPVAIDACGLRASLHLRQGNTDAAARKLGGCPAPEGGDEPLGLLQARAELHFARGESAKARTLSTQLRERFPPDVVTRTWMRPWMLSLLLAHDMDDEATKATLIAGLGDFAQQMPLAQCLAKPDEANCLVIQ